MTNIKAKFRFRSMWIDLNTPRQSKNFNITEKFRFPLVWMDLWTLFTLSFLAIAMAQIAKNGKKYFLSNAPKRYR